MYTLVNLWELSEHKLFDDIRLPVGIDKEILINTIFDECAEFEPLTVDVDLMKAKINNFFARNYDNFKRLYEYTQLEYNPIENYDRYSEINTTDTKNDTRIDNTTNNRTTINSKNTSDSTNNETKISAYDSNTYQNNQLETISNTGSETNNGTDNDTGTLNSNVTSNGTNKVIEHTHGNIGVTTTVQMLEQDTKYWNLNNMYQTIAHKFMFTLTITTL